MSHIRDRLAPFLAGGLVVAVAVGVVLLLRNAVDDGASALTQAKLGQVEATADSFNARVGASLTSASGLGLAPWQLTESSAADQAVLKTYDIDPNAQSGYFLIDNNDIVTAGILLRPNTIGTRFSPPGWPEAKARLASVPAIVLPVSGGGLTTELPSYDFVVAIRGASPTSVRGALVLEQALTPTSAFQREIAQLSEHDPTSAAWFFIDSLGTTVATTNTSGLGEPVENPDYLTAPLGRTTVGNKIVFIAAVPELGWRVVFREDSSQFTEGVSGPLQRVGLIVLLMLLTVGLTLVLMLVRRLRQAREEERRLRELNRAQAEFVSVVSHELRTPVAGVLGFLQTTVDHWSTMTDAERLSTVRRASSNARRLQAMTRDVLDADSIESGRLGYTFVSVDLGAELETAVEASTDTDPTHLVMLTGPPTPITVRADPDRLQQVLGNLLENARRSAPPSEPILVHTKIVEADEPSVRISVIDHGPGIAGGSVERIFDKFVRGDDSAVTGTGLGLYIARKIVEAHGGRIWCDSTAQGTAFVFELPVTIASPALVTEAR